MAKYQDWLTEEGRIKLEGWARSLTDVDIAKNIGITPKTLIEWKKKYPKFADALKNGREVVDFQVENALLKRALGYEVTEYIIDNGKKKAVKKQIPPDVTAIIFWLKNRKYKEWRDKRDIDVKSDVKIENPFEKLTTEELKKLANDNLQNGQ